MTVITSSFIETNNPMRKKSKFKAAKVVERLVFTILVVISFAVMAVVIWINFKDWMK